MALSTSASGVPVSVGIEASKVMPASGSIVVELLQAARRPAPTVSRRGIRRFMLFLSRQCRTSGRERSPALPREKGQRLRELRDELAGTASGVSPGFVDHRAPDVVPNRLRANSIAGE